MKKTKKKQTHKADDERRRYERVKARFLHHDTLCINKYEANEVPF